MDCRSELFDGLDITPEDFSERLVPRHLVRLYVPLREPGVGARERQPESLAFLLKRLPRVLAVDFVAGPPSGQLDDRSLEFIERPVASRVRGETQRSVRVISGDNLARDVRLETERFERRVFRQPGLRGPRECHDPALLHRLSTVGLFKRGGFPRLEKLV